MRRASPSLASTSTDHVVTYDITPPAVTINQAAALDGHGLFPAEVFLAGNSPVAVAAGDVNGDGHPDVVTVDGDSNGDGLVSCWARGRNARRRPYLRGGTRSRPPSPWGTSTATANWTWSRQTAPTTTSRSCWAWGRDVSDARDLRGRICPHRSPWGMSTATATWTWSRRTSAIGNNVSVLLGRGDGTFQAQVTYAVGSCPSSVALGDVNGDGRLDVVTANYLATASRCCWGGGRDVPAPVTYAVGSYPRSVALGDVNGDGRLDLVTANAASRHPSRCCWGGGRDVPDASDLSGRP